MPSWVGAHAWLAATDPGGGRVAVYSLLATLITTTGGVAIALIANWGRSRSDRDRLDRLEREVHADDRPVELRPVVGGRARPRRRR